MHTQMKTRLYTLTTVVFTVFFQRLTLVNAVTTVNWSIQTTTPTYDKSLELRCVVAGTTCCRSSSRIWSRGPLNTDIMIDGGPTASYEGKFREEMNETAGYFSLIIIRLEQSDMNMDYTCTYLISDKKLLAQTPAFEWHPSSSEISITQSDDTSFSSSIQNRYRFLRSAVITKIAPVPTISAKFGEKVLAVQSTIQVYDTWFRNITMSLNEDFQCSPNKMLQITLKAGQYSNNIVDEDVCQCFMCAFKSIGWSLVPAVIFVVIFSVIVICKGAVKHDLVDASTAQLTEETEEIKKDRRLRLFGVIAAILVINTLLPGLVGNFWCTCLGDSFLLWILCGVGTASIGMIIVYKYKYLKDWKDILAIVLYVVTCALILLVVYCYGHEKSDDRDKKKKASSHGTRSSNSGLFSWASCKVDQEPVNPSKNSAPPKGKTTKTPTNERDKKQVAVVKPEVNTKHIKTENREKETSFDDDKDFESKLNKVPQGRLLPVPQLSETSTPRALPKPDALPPIADRRRSERDDLDETAPEKKKNKKKKRQDDDEL